MIEVLFGIVALVVLLAAGLVVVRLGVLAESQRSTLDLLTAQMEEKHRAMLNDLHAGLQRQSDALSQGFSQQSERLRGSVQESGDRLRDSIGQSFDRLRESVGGELKDTRVGLDHLRSTQTEALQASQIAQTQALQSMQLTQTQALADSREAIAKQLAEISQAVQQKQDKLRAEVLETVGKLVVDQSRTQQALLLDTLRRTTEQLTQTIGQLSKTVDGRLEQISGKVTERLDEGFKKTNETFASVMARLATIDEAQKKIDGLTTNVVSLQELLGDKRSRGAFGEVQLEHLVSNVLPADCYALQATLSNGTRADCILRLPEPTGTVAVDSKFPLENYHRMFGAADGERLAAQRQFKADVKKHIDAIGDKYIVPGETADGAVMFVPAEAVFAEIHAYHPELVQYAMQKRVWIVSPTTMMAVLNTARAVIKDVETRQQVHIIKAALSKLSDDFRRFDQRMKNLATHIRQAHEDAQQVQISSEKISKRFVEIEHVRFEGETGAVGAAAAGAASGIALAASDSIN
ncbi:DNA recombination protein RmuC [Chitinimonas koreensis]|uniref:DNA recombination protein RmuC n=1 Tax=Chitinimonas koreensis TaxID=356302 RepID=UPI00041198DD|nr:DNA recombination protein RmuC [Chitinimonas koreensis]QNM98569.1 DNA recombination protein RmuC [Chitinimonas koreensis]